MAPRPIWSGTISFGLVSIPVRMLTATSSRELRFHFVDRRDLEPIGYDKVRKDTGEHVDPEDIVRAFEIEKGRFVPIDSEDLDRLDVELTHSLDICDFVSLEEIDPIYFRQAYYLVPQEGGEKPYRLLVEALEETGRVGIDVLAGVLAHLVVADRLEVATVDEVEAELARARRRQHPDRDADQPERDRPAPDRTWCHAPVVPAREGSKTVAHCEVSGS